MNAYTPKNAVNSDGKKAYIKPALKKIGSVARLTLKAGSLADVMTTRSA